MDSEQQNFQDLLNPSLLKEDINFLTQICQIDTSTKSCHENFFRVQNLVIVELEKLGLKVQKIPCPTQCTKTPPLLYAENDEDSKSINIVLISHIDTVLPPYGLRSEQGRLIGSGVADNKGGVVCALRFLSHLKSLKVQANIKFVCSSSEETGSHGLHGYFKKWGDWGNLILGFEPAQEHNIINQRNGNRWYQVMLHGRSAHAGRFNEASLNAAHEMAIKISKLIELNDHARSFKLSITQVNAGDQSFNRTCGSASFKMDTRFSNFDQREEKHKAIETILSSSFESCSKTGERSRCFYSIEDDCPPMAGHSFYNHLTTKLLKNISKLENQKIESAHSGGAADINYFSNGRNYCLDGLGPIASGMHTKKETVLVSSLATRPMALAFFVQELVQEKVKQQGDVYERKLTQFNHIQV